QFWDVLIPHAIWLYNRTPHSALNGNTPYEIFHSVHMQPGKIPIVGSYGRYLPNNILTRKQTHKFTRTGTRCIFLGMSESPKGIRILDLESSDVIVVSTAEFNDGEMILSRDATLKHLTTTSNTEDMLDCDFIPEPDED